MSQGTAMKRRGPAVATRARRVNAARKSARRGAVGFLVATAGLVSVGIPSAAGLGAPPAATLAPSWSVAANPNPPGSADGTLRALACTSATNCFAVGQTHGVQTLIERWNGTNWVVLPSPDPTGSGGVNNNDLSGVACTSATNCFAVGSKAAATGILIERWSGAAWSVAGASSTGVLSGVSCVGASSCHAVGTRGGKAFAMRWNGAFWGTVVSPNPPGATGSRLTSVSCAAVTTCMAVGSYSTATAMGTLIERWNGTSWTIVASPNPAGATSAGLTGIACPSTANCFAVGGATVSGQPRTLIERWNGTAWSVVPSPNPTVGTPILSSVTCFGVSSCYAVGSKKTYTLVEQWNGIAWSIVASPNPAGAQVSRLGGVTCTAANQCLAVGQTDGRTMAQRWNGSVWAVQPDPAGGSQSRLEGVACPNGTSCFAVGSFLPPGHVFDSRWQPLVERWNGVSWVVVASPNPAGSSDSRLVDVDCVSPTWCFAVGSTTIAGQQRTLAERWDGVGWTIVASPNAPGVSPNALADVDCTSASNCFAVGTTTTDIVGQTLVEHWDGTAWTIAPGAVPGALNGVSCANAGDCLAVGDDHGVSDPAALAMHWNGSTWTSVAGPDPSDDPFLTRAAAVSCTTATACIAVGTTQTGFPPIAGCPAVSFATRWDGTTWSGSATAGNPWLCATSLFDVTCTTSTDCTAVGTYPNSGAGYPGTVIRHWDGSAWAAVSSPNPVNASDSALAAVACASTTDCFAVGASFSDAYQRTLIERYS